MSLLVVAILSILLSVAAQFCLKAGMSGVEVKVALSQPLTLRMPLTVLSDPFVAGGLTLYGLGALLWLGVLAKWDVSKAYPMVGFGFALTVVIGYLGGEHVTASRAAGVALICAGVVLVGRS